MTNWFSDPSHHQQVTAASESSGYQLQVRTATAADLTAIAEIITESFHSHHGLWGWAFPLLRLGIYEDIKYRLSSSAPHHLCLVAINTTANGTPQLVGTVEIGVRFHDSWKQIGKNFIYLSNLAVHPQYRRHGIASRLLVSCEQVSQNWGFHDLYLHVLENNYQARQLYFKLGYQVHQVESNWNLFWLKQSRQILLHKHLTQDGIF
ncbi:MULTISPECIES: GNAT family N-acetyltransferase [unclassified Anabaena]|uniref:GNAT family N-acetyltransferase n=1 Tax=unclassified Anabaena TaxID=2619674 RepID=UPI00083065AD|nr:MULTISPECIES: N-acetyltransferase [unclassified Anabaena]